MEAGYSAVKHGDLSGASEIVYCMLSTTFMCLCWLRQSRHSHLHFLLCLCLPSWWTLLSSYWCQIQFLAAARMASQGWEVFVKETLRELGNYVWIGDQRGWIIQLHIFIPENESSAWPIRERVEVDLKLSFLFSHLWTDLRNGLWVQLFENIAFVWIPWKICFFLTLS